MAYDFEKWVANDRKAVKRNPWYSVCLGVMMLVLLLTGMLDAFGGGTDARRFPSLQPFIMTIVIAGLSSPFARDAWIGPRAQKMFDEFERDVLARATARAYSVLLLLLILLFAWLCLASFNGWSVPHSPAEWFSLGLSMTGIGAALPIFFAELMVPVPPVEDMLDD